MDLVYRNDDRVRREKGRERGGGERMYIGERGKGGQKALEEVEVNGMVGWMSRYVYI